MIDLNALLEELADRPLSADRQLEVEHLLAGLLSDDEETMKFCSEFGERSDASSISKRNFELLKPFLQPLLLASAERLLASERAKNPGIVGKIKNLFKKTRGD